MLLVHIYEFGGKNMRFIDMHCDTIWKLMDLDKTGDFMENQCAVSIPKMRLAGTIAQFFACFTYAGQYDGDYDKCYAHVNEMIAFAEKQLQIYEEEIAPARSFEELTKNASDGKISVILTVEEGGVLNGDEKRLEELYKMGVRLLTPMWNYENCFGYPNSRDSEVMKKGLKPFGIEMVERIGELGMIADVSHASDGTFWDILRFAKGPVVASHSNCRALCNHPRNLTDEMLRALGEAGGAVGLNFYGPFLGTEDASLIGEMTEHILHMIQCGGSELPAIGTDFDGFDGISRLDIPGVDHMERLWEALKKKGVPESILDSIWSGNAMRILKQL